MKRSILAAHCSGRWMRREEFSSSGDLIAGVSDPQLIGDKGKWFSANLEAIHYQVYDQDSRLSNETWVDVDYEPSLIFDEDDVTPNNDEDDDSSSCYSTVSDVVMQMISGDIDGATPTASQAPPFAPVRASSPLPDVQASFPGPSPIAVPFEQFSPAHGRARLHAGNGFPIRWLTGSLEQFLQKLQIGRGTERP